MDDTEERTAPGPGPRRERAGAALVRAIEAAGLGVHACYWRRVRPTRRQWALVVSLVEFGPARGPAFEPWTGRLVDLIEDRAESLEGLEPFDLWAVATDDAEVAAYARALGAAGAVRDRIGAPLRPTPTAGADEPLPPAWVYRLPAPPVDCPRRPP